MKTQVDEIWRPVEGYEKIYEVSNLGNVRSCIRIQTDGFLSLRLTKSKILTPHHVNGYLQLCLYGGEKKHYLVHRLVARAFPEICGEWFEDCDVNHKDENPENNAATNLEVCTRKYNLNYGNRNEKSRKSHYKPVKQMTLNGETIKIFESAKHAEIETGCPSSMITICCRGKQKKSHGFKWMYA